MSDRQVPDQKHLFQAALELPSGERAAFLIEACGDDEALRWRIESLLAAHDRAGSFLERPAILAEAEPAAGPPAPAVGRSYSHFRILEKIGEGGMGEVYLGEDTRLKRKVALKTLPAEMGADPGWRKRFQREAETLAALNHPNIVTIHSIERSGSVQFLTMEFVEGRSLDRCVRPGGLAVAEVLDIGAALSEALAAAHEKGIVHRDLKPANVMLSDDGRVKVLDFGLAKVSESSRLPMAPSAGARGATLSKTGSVMGTAPYMSPEHLEGLPLDGRCDIFSLGVVLYELATGTRPFAGDDAVALSSSIRWNTPTPVTELRPEIPGGLGRLIARCLEKDRERRFQSAREVRDELIELRRGMEPRAPAPARRLRSRGWTAIAAVTLTAAATAAWLGRSIRETVPQIPTASSVPPAAPGAETPLAVLPFADLSPEKNLEYFADGLAEEVLDALSRIRGLRVVGRVSSFQFRGRDTDLQAVGRALNVATILRGSVRTGGDRVRVFAELIRVADDRHLWSNTYDREMGDILSVQSDIARSVAGALKVTLLGGPEIASAHPLNVEAYDAFLQGRYIFERQSPGSLEQSIEWFQKALRHDPTLVPAWVGMAAASCGLADQGYVTMEEGYARCRHAAEQAIVLDETQGEAHANMGWIKMNYDWDWAGAEASFRRAVALEPGHAHVAWLSATFALSQGRLEESMALALRATELEPISAIAQSALAAVAWRAGRMEEADRAARKVLELNPGIPGAHAFLGLIHLWMGRERDALLEMQREPRAADRMQGLALVYHALGRHEDADAALRDLIDTSGGKGAYMIAGVYAYRGELDEAFRWLDRAYTQRAARLAWVKTNPLLKNLEGDPRFLVFLRRMRLAA